MSRLAVGSLEGLASEGYKISVASGSKLVQAGAVLQVVSTTKTDVFTTTSTTYTDITGMSASITPSSASSKILVIVNLSIGFAGGAAAVNVRLVRDSTPICVGNLDGVKPQASIFLRDSVNTGNSGITHLDSPNSTSSVTYKLQGFVNSTARTLTVNRGYLDDNTAAYDGRTASNITLMEIAG